MSVWDYIRSLQCVDFETFQSLVDDECNVLSIFNGSVDHMTGREFVSRLKGGHFENTTKCEIVKMTVEKIPTPPHSPQNAVMYSISDDTIYHRLGRGRDEDGPGIYRMRSEGIITFINGKVVRITYDFAKTKQIDAPSESTGGASFVAGSESEL